MNVKAVVKVMNFHALLRVEASESKATKYATMEAELSAMMRIINNNRNLRLDKSIQLPDPNLPVLRIYIGSDLGFCGSVNTSVNSILQKDRSAEKIVIGRKLRHATEVLLTLNRDDYEESFEKVRQYLKRAVRERCWSAVEIVYNHFYNVSSIKPETKRIYPLEVKADEVIENEWDDFEIEGDAQRLLQDMTLSCMVYELRIAVASAYASENIMRQNATSESLKKLDEIEIEEKRQERKQKSQISFKKTIDSFVNQKSIRQ